MILSEPAATVQIRDPKTKCLADLISARHGKPIKRLLVVGCGSGVEAAVLSQELHCTAMGIDLVSDFSPVASAIAKLEVGDATELRFGDGSFDFVYSYHALEHIPDYRKALSEMNRVLADGGGYCVGTPNRSRLIAYLGSKEATLNQMLRWNIAEWRARLQGRFRNECGAHAGFTKDELETELRAAFGDVGDISLGYYLAVYSKRQSLIRGLHSCGLSRLFFPSIYFVGVKKDQALK